MESNLVASSATQKNYYNKRSCSQTFHVNDHVWLSVPVAGKLDPKWEGGWKVTTVTSPVTVTISDGKRSKVVHVNRLQHRVQPMDSDGHVTDSSIMQQWRPPDIEHFIEPSTVPRRNPPRARRPPDYYRP